MRGRFIQNSDRIYGITVELCVSRLEFASRITVLNGLSISSGQYLM